MLVAIGLILTCLIRTGQQAPVYIFWTYVLTYATGPLGMPRQHILVDTLIASAVSSVPGLVLLAAILAPVVQDIQYRPQAALIAEAFPPRVRYSGASLGYHLASITAGGPAPIIAAALYSQYGSSISIVAYIVICALISVVRAAVLRPSGGSIFSRVLTVSLTRSSIVQRGKSVGGTSRILSQRLFPSGANPKSCASFVQVLRR